MSGQINHKHNNLGELTIKQYHGSGNQSPIKEKKIKKNGDFKIEKVQDPFYIVFSFPADCLYTIDWGDRYGVEVTTVKEHQSNPKLVRAIFKLYKRKLSNPATPPKEDVDVTPPNDYPFVETV